ncbi:MAG: DUF1566 domain-containing protein [Deltaproteobacteria bacterium]|nr:DUF1566 domain-containing protein [Deltaproteobacteria bacterium]
MRQAAFVNFLILAVILACLTACENGNESDSDDDAAVSDDDDDDGVWTDPTSGLMWQTDESHSSGSAETNCSDLTLAGFDDWRLPSISELRTLIRGCPTTQTGGACSVTDDCLEADCADDACTTCAAQEGPSNGCYGPAELPESCFLFASTSKVADADGDTYRWYVNFDSGSVVNFVECDGCKKSFSTYKRCVR